MRGQRWPGARKRRGSIDDDLCEGDSTDTRAHIHAARFNCVHYSKYLEA